jgi:ubiquinone/menaquinone biosynthesis C-methylase UbiE
MQQAQHPQRQMWEAGDYAALAPHIAHVGERVVARAGVEAGMRVLDVACGTGSAALPAARAGAQVTGLDLVPKLLEAGRRKAEEAGLEIEWVEGDAADLPFADSTFDCVLSTFGHMFSPDHRRTADEMTRVCRPGGVLATCTWIPEGTVGATFAATAPYLPPPPGSASPPILWGTEEHVREMFGSAASAFEFERHSATIEWDSLEGFADVFMEHFPPMVATRAMLGARFADLRADVVAVWAERNQAADGSLHLPQEYLLSVVRR